MGLLAFSSGSDEEESWRSDDDDDPAVLRSGAGAKADVCSKGAVASARAATSIFILIVWTTSLSLRGKEMQLLLAHHQAVHKHKAQRSKIRDPRGDVMQFVRS